MVSAVTQFPNGVGVGVNAETLKIPGKCAANMLRVAADVVAEETVVIGAATFRVAVVNTDSTKDVAVAMVVEKYTNFYMAAHGLIGGDLIRIENEICQVQYVINANEVALIRGVSGTTIATHAATTSIYTEATPGGGSIGVGLVATLTPTAFTAALVADINNRDRNVAVAVLATLISVNSVLVVTADAPGGNPVASASALACTETLGGSGNAWDDTTFVGGIAPGVQMVIRHVPTSEEATAALIQMVFPHPPVSAFARVRTTATMAEIAWDGVITITGNRITLDNAGSTDWTASTTIDLFVTF